MDNVAYSRVESVSQTARAAPPTSCVSNCVGGPPCGYPCSKKSDLLSDWIVNGNQFGAVGKRSVNLNLVDHFENAFHDVFTT